MPPSSALSLRGLLLLGANAVLSASVGPGSNAPPWDLTAFKTLVAFGDSYTDDSRLNYFAANNGSAPPVGWFDPANYNAADGGRPWPQYIKQYTGASLYNYAVSGAVCSNTITPRTFSTINAPFPAIAQYEVPAYLADSNYTYPNGSKFLTADAASTVYSFWIGTNDLGVYAFITDSQVAGKVIPDYLDCVYDQIARVYANGGRYFVLMNIAPLDLAPLYGLPGQGGVGANHYWPEKDGTNITEVSYRMREIVATVNAIYAFRTPFAAEVRRRYPGARFAVYDVHGLMTDIYNNPATYLNGSAPLNVTGFDKHCNLNGTVCTQAPSPDSYLWFDELHPSEQTERVIARNFVDVVAGNSSWATYWRG